MIKIIGLTGKMGTGKSTASAILREINPASALIKFAAPIYRIQDAIYNEIKTVYPQQANLKDRKLLQFIGTDWGRSIDPEVWIKLWKAEVAHVYEFAYLYKLSTHLIITDDVRFNNEAQIIREMGGIVIEITSNKVDDRDVVGKELNNHESENGVDRNLINVIINNNTSIDELKIKLMTVLKEMN